MSKRSIFLFLVAGLAFLTVAPAILKRRSEPECAGRKLSTWVEMLYKRHSGEETLPAEKALQAIGTNALPYLLDWAGYEAPYWKQKLNGVAGPTIRRLRPSWDLVYRAEYRAGAACEALMVIGPAGGAEIARLNELLCDPTKPTAAARAEAVLASFGEAGLPPLIGVLSNSQSPAALRCRILIHLPAESTNARPAIPALRQVLKDPNPMLRDLALSALQAIAPDALSSDELLRASRRLQ